jgi:hypothetical protein
MFRITPKKTNKQKQQHSRDSRDGCKRELTQ